MPGTVTLKDLGYATYEEWRKRIATAYRDEKVIREVQEVLEKYPGVHCKLLFPEGGAVTF